MTLMPTAALVTRNEKLDKTRNAVPVSKARLQQEHGSDYSADQYTLWAEMLVGETHDSFDSPLQE